MTASYVERDQASPETAAFYDKAEDRFQALLNIFKVFGHQPEYGTVFTDMIMAILKDGEIDWLTKELLILKATQRNDCKYCVVQHERLCEMLGLPAEKVADIDGDKYKTSPHFTDGERALLDLTVTDRHRREPRAERTVGPAASALDRAADRRRDLRDLHLHRGLEVRRCAGRRARAYVRRREAGPDHCPLGVEGVRAARPASPPAEK